MPQLFLLPWVVGWSALYGGVSPLSRLDLSYRIDATFCDRVLPKFHEDWLLSLHALTCDDVHAAVRHAFDAWQHQATLSFYETSDDALAQIVIRSDRLDDEDVVANAVGVWDFERHAPGRIYITTAPPRCWYTDSSFCHAILTHATAVYAALIAVGALGALMTGINLSRVVRPFEGNLRILAWSLTIAPILIYFGAILPCTTCSDFQVTMMHEIGHAIGLAHPDAEENVNWCGCEAPVPCTFEGSAVMQRILEARDRSCLSQDDVDAVRSIYGGDCDQPAWCYEFVSFAGFARFAVALLYAVLVSWTIVGLRTMWYRCRTASRPPTRPPRSMPPTRPPRSMPPTRPLRPVPVTRPPRSVHMLPVTHRI